MFNVSDLESWEAWDWIAIAIAIAIGNEERKMMVVDNGQWIWIWRLAQGINSLLNLSVVSSMFFHLLLSLFSLSLSHTLFAFVAAVFCR